jgi:uncharacterized membrane protein
MAAQQPHELTIRDPLDETSATEIPRFTAKSDDTIVWESKDLCIEASGFESGNVARLNHCTGGLTQKWRWLPWGPIQLKGTNQCLDAFDTKGGLNGALIGLRECENVASESWKFERPEKQQVDTPDAHHANLLLNLAILYWTGLSSALIVSIFDKLRSKGVRTQSQPLFSGAQVAAVMAVKPDPVSRNDGVAMTATSPTMVARESTTRSAVKAVGWRLTAGIVTACTSMIFTGSLATAAAIVGWDLCSKSVTMFIGERLWNKFDWGRDNAKGEDSNKRSLAKALAWRVFAAFNTLFASIVLTKGNAGVAGKIAGADTVVKTVLFFFYERMWAKISWGKLLREETEEIRLENMEAAAA